jgi:transposase
MPAHPKPELRAGVKRLALEGKNLSIIAQELNVSLGSVIYQIKALLDDGEIPRARYRRGKLEREASAMKTVKRRYGVSFGRMGQFVDTLTDSQIDWLVKQIPEGGTLADVLRSIVVDAIADDQS